jgi:hypothetical protein
VIQRFEVGTAPIAWARVENVVEASQSRPQGRVGHGRNMRNRYRPPRAPVEDIGLSTSGANVWDTIIVLSLLAMWILDFPHHAISGLIGQHFPWPVQRSLKWPALLLERTLIEAVICIPVALVLAVRLRQSAVVFAWLLAAVLCGRIAFELPKTPAGSVDWRFLCVIGGIHATLLVGATAYIAHRRRLRAGPADAREN